ncbi:MAG: peptidyl-prolyl cis-trans isomerase [Deltaproteobacteria bacterium]|nr:peptidyl-prolyl cis-trans isomerase [Deltaproteobacteria bacterium]
MPLTDLDLRVASGATEAASTHADVPAPVPLAALVRDELARQTALALGLDADPDYRRELAEMQARLEGFQRERLAGMYFRAEIARRAVVNEAEARRYFEANRERIRTELLVWQILVRDEDGAERAAAELAAGEPFEEVAREQLPDVPAMERSPWDLGYLRWNQIPEPWRPVVYDLAAGGTSGVIRGPNRRFWIVKLVARRENPGLTFDAVREPLLALLRDERRLEARPAIERRLLESASVEYPAPPTAGAVRGPGASPPPPLTAP